MIQFEPRLHIDDDTAGQLAGMLLPLFESPTVLMTDAYSFGLAAEIVGEVVRVRAATGEEMTEFLTAGDIPSEDGLEWPGDPAMPTGREIDWQETEDSEVETERACHLWSGEVILKSGRGASGPFFVHEQAARASALAMALAMPEADVFGMQVIPYACVRRFAPGLINGGEVEFNRLNRFWISPLRSWGLVEQIPLPGMDP